MKGSRKFFIIAGAVAVALLAFRGFVVAPTADEADRQRNKLQNLAAERAGYFRSNGKPIAEIEEKLTDEKARLERLGTVLDGVELELPPELEAKDGQGTLYFQRQLAALGKEAQRGGLTASGKAKQLGFQAEVPQDMVPEYLARLGVAKRFVKAAIVAGVQTMTRADNPVSRVVSQPEATIELEELVYKATVQTDEKGLIRLLQEISKPGNFLALKGLRVQVSDPDAGAFEAELEVAGVRSRKIEAHTEPKKLEGTPDRGTSVPVRRRGRF